MPGMGEAANVAGGRIGRTRTAVIANDAAPASRSTPRRNDDLPRSSQRSTTMAPAAMSGGKIPAA